MSAAPVLIALLWFIGAAVVLCAYFIVIGFLVEALDPWMKGTMRRFFKGTDRSKDDVR